VDPSDPVNRSTVYLLRSILAMPTQTTVSAGEADAAALSEALRWVNLSIQQNGANAGAYARRAMLLYGDPRHRASVMEDLNRALELNPTLVEPRAMLIDLHMQEDDPNEAIRELRQLLTQQPNNPQVRITLVNLYLKTGDEL